MITNLECALGVHYGCSLSEVLHEQGWKSSSCGQKLLDMYAMYNAYDSHHTDRTVGCPRFAINN